MHQIASFALSATLLASLLLCCDDDAEPIPDEAPGGSWVVAIYMAADNNLDAFASRDLIELVEHGPPDNVEVLVFIDRTEPGVYTIPDVPGLDSFSGARIYRVTQDATFELVEDLGEVDSTSVDVLHDFVVRTFDTPAEHRAMILWDHGSPRSFGSDETNGRGSLSIDEVEQSFLLDPDDSESGHYRLDILGVDACLMSSLDALGALYQVTDIYIASAELEPGDGWDYDGVMIGMYSNDLTPELFARRIVEAFDDYYTDNPGREGGLDVTLAAWHTNVDPLSTALDRWDARWQTATDNDPANVYAQGRQAVADSHPYWDSGSGQSRYVDVGNLFANVSDGGESDEIAQLTEDVVAELERLQIAYSAHDSLPDTLGMSYTVRNLEYLRNPPESGETLRAGTLDDMLVGGEGSVRESLAASDEAPPVATLRVTSTEPGAHVDIATVDWSAEDDVALESVILMAGIATGNSTMLVTYAVDEPAGAGVASARGQTPVALGGVGLTDGSRPTAEDLGLVLRIRERSFLPGMWSANDQSGLGLLIVDKSLDIQGVAVQMIGEVWSVFAWEDVSRLPIRMAPIRVTIDSSGERSEEVGSMVDVQDLHVEAVPLTGPDIVVVGLVEDLAGNLGSVVVEIE